MADNSLSVAVVGAGYMGKGIAHTLARGGATVALADVDAATAQAAYSAMLDEVATGERRQLFAPESTELVRDRVAPAHSIQAAVVDADFVMEVVVEDLAVKRHTLRTIEAAARRDAVLATNTSAIPIADLATALVHRDRFFGVHWFNPAPHLPAVEVIAGEQSDQRLLGPILDLLGSAGKAPVIVADTPGFICNRLQFALFKEAALMVEDGTSTPEQIDAVVRSSFGFRLPFFGPFAIADMAGLDVYASSYTTLEATLGRRFACPVSLRDRVDGGDLGIKSGGGYLAMTPEDAQAMTSRRDRSYAALSVLRASLEG